MALWPDQFLSHAPFRKGLDHEQEVSLANRLGMVRIMGNGWPLIPIQLASGAGGSTSRGHPKQHP